jgi:hypothetical protein
MYTVQTMSTGAGSTGGAWWYVDRLGGASRWKHHARPFATREEAEAEASRLRAVGFFGAPSFRVQEVR